jgi:CubicO group peptidase (beta-lactamase class C family)
MTKVIRSETIRLAFALLVTVAVLTLSTDANAESRNSQVDGLFAQWNKPDSPGCAVSVKKNGVIVFERGYGMANLDHNIPITPDTVFHASSLAKQFTAMAVMLMVNQRRLSLTDDVRGLAPLPDAIRDPITISDVLHHVSGIRDQWTLITMAGWRLSDDVIKQEDVLNLIRRMKTLNFRPGNGFSYSNTNYTLAALIVERASGEPLSEFLRKMVFSPLGMTRSIIIMRHGEVVKNRAYGYRVAGSSFEIRMPNYDLVGPTNLLTTVQDLMRWEENFDSKIVGGASAVSELITPTTMSKGYGLGLFIRKDMGTDIVEHDGRDAGYRSHLIRFPEKKLAVALLCNVTSAETTSLVRGVAMIFDPTLQGSSNPPPEAPDETFVPRHLSDYIGRYYSDEIDVTYEVTLTGSTLVIARPRYDPVKLEPTAREKFLAYKFSALLDPAVVWFRRDAAGKIYGFHLEGAAGANRLSHFLFAKVP